MLKNKAKAKAKEEEKRKRNFFYPSLVGSEVSGAELGRADYDLIPTTINGSIKGVTPTFCTRALRFMIRITTRTLYYEHIRITGLILLRINEKIFEYRKNICLSLVS